MNDAVPTAEARQIPGQPILIEIVRNEIKVTTEETRAFRPHVKRMQRVSEPSAPAMQSRLARNRHRARCRYLIYGALRGRSWGQTESAHPEGDAEFRWLVRLAIVEYKAKWPGFADWNEVYALLGIPVKHRS